MSDSTHPPLPPEAVKGWLSDLNPEDRRLVDLLRQMPKTTVFGEVLKAEREAALNGNDPLDQFKRNRAEKNLTTALQASKDAIAQSEIDSGLTSDRRPGERLIRKKGLAR